MRLDIYRFLYMFFEYVTELAARMCILSKWMNINRFLYMILECAMELALSMHCGRHRRHVKTSLGVEKVLW